METILSLVEPRLPTNAAQPLMVPISLNELGMAAKELAHGKSQRLHGQAIDFYVKLWHVIGTEFHQMIMDSFQCGFLLYGMNSRLIVLLHKGGQTDLLENYRPNTLQNVSYKILAKVLHKRFQPFLP